MQEREEPRYGGSDAGNPCRCKEQNYNALDPRRAERRHCVKHTNEIRRGITARIVSSLAILSSILHAKAPGFLFALRLVFCAFTPRAVFVNIVDRFVRDLAQGSAGPGDRISFCVFDGHAAKIQYASNSADRVGTPAKSEKEDSIPRLVH